MALISATELITRYYSNEKLPICCFNVRPTSATLADIIPTFDERAVLPGKALTVNMLEVNCFQTPTVTQSPHERNGELFPYRCSSSI